MITNDEITDAYSEVLDAAGAKPCVSCGKRAAIRTDIAVTGQPDRDDERLHDHVDRAKWFCFECGHEE
jgi:hypothetical protein